MNGRQSKKIRQYYNRNVRQMVEAELRVLTKILRPRPKYLPKWVWLLLMLVFFQKSYVGKQRQAVKDYKIRQAHRKINKYKPIKQSEEPLYEDGSIKLIKQINADKKNKNKDTTTGGIQPKDDNKETSGESKGTIKE